MNQATVQRIPNIMRVMLLFMLALLAAPATLSAQEAPSPVRSPADLAATAAARGQVRVIVQLDTAFQPEGELQSEAFVQRQRASIQQTQTQVLAELSAYDAELIAAWETIPFMAVTVDAEGLKALQRSAQVADIQPDRLAEPLLNGSTVHIGAPKAWSAGYDGSGQMVVILDTGIDSTHPFFGSRVIAEACFSSKHIRTPDDDPADDYGKSLCPNGLTSQFGTGAASAFVPECTVGLNGGNRCWHGTHVAGIAAGANPGDVNFSGVAKGSDIAAIQVFTRFTTSDVCGSNQTDCLLSYTSDQISALEYILTELALTHAVAAVNMSLGGTHYTDQTACDLANLAIKAAIDNLRAEGIATIIAAGNSYTRNAIAEPACISTAVAVSNVTDPQDRVSGSASMGEMVDLLAPGSSVTSALPNNWYIGLGGTSMAAPHVAGAWAILKEINPTATVDELLALLQDTGPLITDQRSGGTVTKPRIDLCAALTELGIGTGIQLNAKVMLQGAFRDVSGGAGFISGSFMRDTLRTAGVLPTNEPYSAQFGIGRAESIANRTEVLADRGDDSIVDWVYLELRDATSPVTVLATRAALVQRDGDIVDVDGVSPVNFTCIEPSDYYVAVRHRNHLGAMTAVAISLAATGTTVDFTDSALALWHNEPAYEGHAQTLLNGLNMLWAGDATQGGAISYVGGSADSAAVNQAILDARDNDLNSLGYVDAGYRAADLDLDGRVIADGPGNEHGLILDNVLNHPLNTLHAQDFFIVEQLARLGP